MKILLVSFYFPPGNSMGGVRAGKMAKYFLDQGHDVRVLTVENDTLEKTLPLEIPSSLITRTRWLNINRVPNLYRAKRADDLGNILRRRSYVAHKLGWAYRTVLNFPDGQIGWLPFAVYAGLKMVETWTPDVIYASARPFTSFLVARIISQMTKVPWVAEFRDLWAQNPYYDYPIWRQKIETQLEKIILKNASGVVSVSAPLVKALDELHKKPSVVIQNGFDPEDLPTSNSMSFQARDSLEIVYTGMIYSGRRDPTPLFRALQLLGNLKGRIRVKFYGRFLESILPIAQKEGVAHLVEIHAPLPYRDCLWEQARADILLLLLWNDPREEGVFTGKIFEYFGARRPILALGLDRGVAGQLIREREAGLVSNDPTALAKQLKCWLMLKEKTGCIPSLPDDALHGLARFDQFKKSEQFLRDIVSRPVAGVPSAKVVPNSQFSLAIIIPSLKIGGTEKHLLQILPKLKNSFATIKVIVLHPGGEIRLHLLEQGIQVIEVPKKLQSWFGPLGASIFLFGFFLRERVHAVHFFLPEAYLIGGLCALPFLRHVKIMSRRNLNNYQEKYMIGGWVERRLHAQMDALLGNSKAVVTQLKQEKGNPRKIGLIYNGIEVNDFSMLPSRKECRRKLELPLEGLIFITVANLHAYKGHEVLLKGLGRIVQDLPRDWMLLCLGRDEGIGGHLKNISRQLNIDSHVRWLGEVQDVRSFLGAASLGVLASREEGFSNSILEGMASGLPMIVTDVGGNSEAVVNKHTGFVVPPNDPVALGEALLALASDPALCERMGKEGQKRVEAEFSVDKCVQSYEQVYFGLMETPQKSVDEVLK